MLNTQKFGFDASCYLNNHYEQFEDFFCNCFISKSPQFFGGREKANVIKFHASEREKVFQTKLSQYYCKTSQNAYMENVRGGWNMCSEWGNIYSDLFYEYVHHVLLQCINKPFKDLSIDASYTAIVMLIHSTYIHEFPFSTTYRCRETELLYVCFKFSFFAEVFIVTSKLFFFTLSGWGLAMCIVWVGCCHFGLWDVL